MQNYNYPEYTGAGILSEIDVNLVRYSRKVVGMLYAHSKISNKETSNVLDFGAGQGSLTKIWKEISGVAPDCVELDPVLRLKLQEMGFNAAREIANLNRAYDFIYSSNVLEHIEDDDEALFQLMSVLSPGGLIGIYVPAFPILYTDFDEAVGHFRRYRMKKLCEKLKNAGAQIVFSSYSDSIGFFSVGLLKLLGFNFQQSKSVPKLMRFYDKYLLPFSDFLDWVGFRHVLGKNLLIIARKT